MELLVPEIECIKNSKFASMLRVYSYMVDPRVVWIGVLAKLGYTDASISELMRTVRTNMLVRYLMPNLPDYGIYMSEDQFVASIRPEYREDAEAFLLEYSMLRV